MEGEMQKKEYQLQAVCFAAGTAVLIACLEQAVVRSFIEQWRVLMFLALNLLLLAILLTSASPTSSKIHLQASTTGGDQSFKAAAAAAAAEAESKKRRKQCGGAAAAAVLVADDEEDEVKKEVISETLFKGQEIIEEAAHDDDDMKEQAALIQLSKEELNERVEAFIVMFRQQYLISDAKQRSCRKRPKHSPLVNKVYTTLC